MIHGGRCAVKENKPDRTVTRVNINYNSTVDGIISERPVAYCFFYVIALLNITLALVENCSWCSDLRITNLHS